MYSHVLHSISFANSFLNGPPAARVGCTMEAVLEGTPARSTGTCIEKTKHNKQPHGRKSLSRSNCDPVEIDACKRDPVFVIAG